MLALLLLLDLLLLSPPELLLLLLLAFLLLSKRSASAGRMPASTARRGSAKHAYSGAAAAAAGMRASTTAGAATARARRGTRRARVAAKQWLCLLVLCRTCFRGLLKVLLSVHRCHLQRCQPAAAAGAGTPAAAAASSSAALRHNWRPCVAAGAPAAGIAWPGVRARPAADAAGLQGRPLLLDGGLRALQAPQGLSAAASSAAPTPNQWWRRHDRLAAHLQLRRALLRQRAPHRPRAAACLLRPDTRDELDLERPLAQRGR